ncbi:MAG: radical SAM protein [Bacteroidales bacterium]|nr:radical SAM protein [Bacteroidales bacterium]
MVDLQEYMSGSIRNIMTAAYRNMLHNPREAKFAYRMQQIFSKSEKRRKSIADKENIDVPPFLICSIATQCNLHCKGCYARSNGIANDVDDNSRPTLAAEQWHAIFSEAADLGVNFALLAGGEPMMRRDVLEAAAQVDNMIFPVFTNGTLIGPSNIDFLRKNFNIIPIISIEGSADGTDNRRGKGIYQRAMLSMDMLHNEHLFFGTSITVTTENFRDVTSSQFLGGLQGKGCKLVFYVEYVPTEKGTEQLAFSDSQVEEMEQRLESVREQFDDIIFLSFPGDEKAVGGCLASGRGFFHIGPDGSAEPCPFSPFSDSNVLNLGVKGALQSPLFRKLRDLHALGWEHTGGCTLFEHRDEVAQLLK